MTVKADIQSLDPGAIVEMFVLDAMAQGDTQVRYFHAGTNELGTSVIWQGNVYSPFPVMAEGFEWNGRGTIPQPKLKIANIGGSISSLTRPLQDMVGAKITRKRTFVKYLDAANFSGGNANANPLEHFTDEIFYVNRKVMENKVFVEWELAPAWDVTGVKLPRRQVIQNVCPWRYRSAECGYAGTVYFKADDTSTANAAEDVCGKRLASCKLRFGSYAELPFGGFPGAGLYR